MSALAEALAAAQAELPIAVERDSQGIGYRYTSLDKLIAATRPILSKHGLTITQWPTMVARGGTEGGYVPGLRTRVELTGDAEVRNYEYRDYIEDTTPLYLTDKTMQGLGAAITYARRYAWAAALGIASEEDTDAATIKADEEDVPF